MRAARTLLKVAPAMDTAILLRGVAYHIDEIAPIERIPALAQDPQLLAAFKAAGYRSYAHSDRSLAALAIRSAQKTLAAADLSADDLDAVVIGTSEIREPNRYPEMLSTEVLTALELSGIPVAGVTLAGCANFSSSLRVARNMIIAERLNHILVIEADQVRGALERQTFLNNTALGIFADGAASVVVSAERADGDRASGFELVAMAQIVRPIDVSRAPPVEITKNNFLGFRRVIDEVLDRTGATLTDFAEIFLSNVGIQFGSATAAMLELPLGSIHMENCSRTAHVWSCDNLINLVDHCAARDVPEGALFLMLSQADAYYSAIACRKR